MTIFKVGPVFDFVRVDAPEPPVRGGAKSFEHLVNTSPLNFGVESGRTLAEVLTTSPLNSTVPAQPHTAAVTVAPQDPKLNWTAAQWRAHDRAETYGDTQRWWVLGEAGVSAFGGVLAWAGGKFLGPALGRFLSVGNPTASGALSLDTKVAVVAGLGNKFGDKVFGNGLAQGYLREMLSGKWTKDSWLNMASDGKDAVLRAMDRLRTKGHGDTADLIHEIQMGRKLLSDISGKARSHLNDAIQWLGRDAAKHADKEKFLLDVAKKIPE